VKSLTIRNLSKTYFDLYAATHVTAVQDVSLEVGAGEFVSIVGPSGCGKSTILNMIAGFVPVTGGEILVGGKPVNGPGRDRGVVFQSFALFPWRTVLENVAFGPKMRGIGKAEREKIAHEYLALARLTEAAERYPNELSGGMQQRVGLARALATDPEIMLFDEPFSALDPLIRRDMQDEVVRLQRELKKTMIFITHDLAEALKLGDRIAIMKDGQVIQVGTPDEILRSPADDYVRSFVRGVDAAAVFKAADIARKSLTVVCEHPERGARAALKVLEDQDRDFAYVTSPNRRFLGVVSADTLRSALDGHSGPLGLRHAFLDDLPRIDAEAPVAGLIGQLAQAPCALPVVASDGRFCGAISKTTLLKFLDRDTPPIEPVLPNAAPALAAEPH